MSVYQLKDGRWVVSFRIQGSRTTKKKYFGRGNDAKRQAMQFDLELNEAKLQGDLVQSLIVDKAKEQQEMTFFNLATTYLAQHPLSPRSYEAIAYALNAHILNLWGHLPVDALSMADFVSLDNKLLKPRKKLIQLKNGLTKEQVIPPLSVSSRNRIKSYCRAICQWGVDKELISKNPFEKYKPDRKNEGTAPDLVTNEELQLMWANAAPHLQWAIKCIMYLGVRPGKTELFCLKMSDIDFNDKTIWLTRSKTHSRRSKQAFSEDFLTELKELQLKEPQRVWLIEYKGQPVNSLKTAWRQMLRRAGITRRIRLYDLRHWYATTIVAGGADLKSASSLLGHSSPDLTLKTYAHLIEGQKKKAANLIKLPFN